jgi:uncharacterized damage-inducible protein DinB
MRITTLQGDSPIVSTVRTDIRISPDLSPGTGLLLGVLDQTTREWREELGSVPGEAVVWQPFPGGHSIGAVILHIAYVEAMWIHKVGAGHALSREQIETLLPEKTHVNDVLWPIPPDRPLSWYCAQADSVRARTREIVAELNDLERVSSHADFGDEEFTLRWLLGHVIAHEAYHGGQAVLLSLMRAASLEK